MHLKSLETSPPPLGEKVRMAKSGGLYAIFSVCIVVPHDPLLTAMFGGHRFSNMGGVRIVAQCSAKPEIVAATPPCSATPFQRQLDV